MVTRVQRDPDLYNAGWLRKRRARIATRRPRQPALLTPRELEVLRLTADGLTRKEIAGQLCVSPFTVKHHLVAVFDALGPRTAAGAVAKALREGLIQ